MTTGIDTTDHKLFFEQVRGRKGDHVDMHAEMDAIVAFSSCPTGDGRDEPAVYPLHAEIFQPPP